MFIFFGFYEIVVVVEEENENKFFKVFFIFESLYDEELNEEDVVMQFLSIVEEMRKFVGVLFNQRNYSFLKNKIFLEKDVLLENAFLEVNK